MAKSKSGAFASRALAARARLWSGLAGSSAGAARWAGSVRLLRGLAKAHFVWVLYAALVCVSTELAWSEPGAFWLPFGAWEDRAATLRGLGDTRVWAFMTAMLGMWSGALCAVAMVYGERFLIRGAEASRERAQETGERARAALEAQALEAAAGPGVKGSRRARL